MKFRFRSSAAAMFLVVMTAVSIATPVSAATSSAPRSGGNLTILIDGLSWASTDPIQPVGTTASFDSTQLAYQNLFNFNASGQVVPLLATSYSYNAAHTVLTITLRKGVKFQDGTPFNAQAVVFNLERVAPASSDSECVPFLSTVSSFTAVGQYRVQITTAAPYSALVDILAGEACTFMASPTAIQTEGSRFAEAPVGTSPFAWQSYIANQTIHYTRFASSWQKAHLSGITIQNVGDDNSAIDAVEAGTAQAFSGSYNQIQDIPLARANGKLTVDLSADNTTTFLRFVYNTAPFDNIWARRAVAAAIDAPAIAKTLYARGTAQWTQSIEPPQSWAFNGNRVKGFPQYSPKNAAADVAQLPGGKLNFSFTLQAIPGYVQLAEAIAGELQAIPGITVTLQPYATSQYLVLLHSRQYQALLAAGPALPDPDFTYYRNFASTSNNNQQAYSNPAMDSLVVEARETFSQPQRKKLYEQAAGVLASTVGVVPLFSSPCFFITSKRVHDTPVTGASTEDMAQTWLS